MFPFGQPLEDYQLGGPGIGYHVYYRRNLTDTWTNKVCHECSYSDPEPSRVFFDNGLSLLYTELVDLISLLYQVQLTGNVGKYVTQVGAYNYYLLYDVMIQPYNDLGQGPNSSVSTIYSAEESKSQTEHNDIVSVILNMKNKITSNNIVLLLVIHQQHSIRKLGAKSRLRFSFAIPVSYSYLLPICLCDRMG